MSTANVNLGSGPNAGDGDPLRVAFNIINTNFAGLTANVSGLTNSVQSVAGRTGNVILTVQDINGLDLYQRTAVPSTSKGHSFDRIGQIAYNSSYIYYCIANYTTGADDIWKRISWSADTW
jgi:hypothetical protein